MISTNIFIRYIRKYGDFDREVKYIKNNSEILELKNIMTEIKTHI